ncbi:MAG TPA: hypothetical protein DCY93_01620 [Firmicutes bacterium]|nr:hypothetical protein [Bacillota bacterium]
MAVIIDAKEQDKFDWKLFLITFFLGWLGIDKFYVGGGKAWKYFLFKLGFTFILLGVIWNIIDLIMIIRKKYQLDAREYFY